MTDNVKDENVASMQRRFDDHLNAYSERCIREDAKWADLVTAQEKNTESIKELVASTKELTESTHGIITTWQAANGAVKTLSALGRAVKLMAAVTAVVLVGYSWIADHVKVSWLG